MLANLILLIGRSQLTVRGGYGPSRGNNVDVRSRATRLNFAKAGGLEKLAEENSDPEKLRDIPDRQKRVVKSRGAKTNPQEPAKYTARRK